jgi:hypothetical protein
MFVSLAALEHCDSYICMGLTRRRWPPQALFVCDFKGCGARFEEMQHLIDHQETHTWACIACTQVGAPAAAASALPCAARC